MKKTISMIVILMLVLVITQSVYAVDTQPSDYGLYYQQFVDSTEPLSVLEEKDLSAWSAADITHPIISTILDINRTDYLDIPYGTDPNQKLDIYHEKGKTGQPVIIFIHGGGWTNGDKSDVRYGGPTWLSLGYTVVSVNYRLGPQNPHPAQIEDCAKALKWVIENIKEYGGDPNRISITGHSAGGHLAALLVTDKEWSMKYNIEMNRVKCCIPISGIYDFSLKENYYHPWMEMFTDNLFSGLPNIQASKEHASAIEHITGDEPPVLIIQGGDDWLVPKSNAIFFFNALKAKGIKVELEIIKGIWHCNAFANYGDSGNITTELVNRFLAEYLPTPENNPLMYTQYFNDNAKMNFTNIINNLLQIVKAN